MNQADALALAMLGVLAASLGCVALILLSVYRRQKAGPCEVEELIREAKADASAEAPTSSPEQPPKLESWERQADWWKTD